ncbi:hypothetical protein AYI68_g1040 [Smittium mucronatum]|uniref:Uncharacterized protein n=1 Tax=Smittium mucronatum TaxID=133383 RepID=A0A1R0H6N5_9FUNG|nr:hypothetical protein AYI68_g1040 [Smittium mucronatum]
MAGNFCPRFQRWKSLTMPATQPGDNCGLTYLFRFVDTYPGIDTYQRQGAIDSIICTSVPECCWSVGINIFRQYHHAGICEEVWRYHLPQIARDFRGNLAALPEDEYSTSGNLRTVSDQPGRCSEPVSSEDRMVSTRLSVCNDKPVVWISPHVSIRESDEQESVVVLQLVFGPQGCRKKLSSVQLGNMEQSLHLHSMESNPTKEPEGGPGTSKNYARTSAMEDSDFFPRPNETIVQSTIVTTSDNGNTRPKKRKITDVEEQTLVPDSMNNQRKILKAQVSADTAIDLIVSNQRETKRRSRYHSIKQQFLNWNIRNNPSEPVKASHVVNFLAYIFTTKKLLVNKIKAYKSAIISLVTEPRSIENSHCLAKNLSAIDETEIKSFVRPTIDISLIISRLREWGDTCDIEIKNLTIKTCWLLAICGFLRASDIHRIDDARTTVINGTLKLVILAPKEKQNGKIIERPCEIGSHPNPIFFHVIAYKL